METNKEEDDIFNSQQSFSDIWNHEIQSQDLEQIMNNFNKPSCTSSSTEPEYTHPTQPVYGQINQFTPQQDVNYTQLTTNNFQNPPYDNTARPYYPQVDLKRLPLIPIIDDPGNFGFHINFGMKTNSAPKSAPYTYSHGLDRLFVMPNTKCPINFKCDLQPPEGCIIRAVATFKSQEFASHLVTRCHQHRMENKENYFPDGHFVRVEMPDERNVKYELTVEGRESVRVLFQPPLKGSEYATILYRFTCLSSCPSIDKRVVLIVFQLESNEGEILGRRVAEVRVCTCTGRDRRNQEAKILQVSPSEKVPITKKRVKPSNNNNIQVKIKKEVLSDSEEEVYNLQIKGKKHYEMLKEIRDGLVALKSQQSG